MCKILCDRLNDSSLPVLCVTVSVHLVQWTSCRPSLSLWMIELAEDMQDLPHERRTHLVSEAFMSLIILCRIILCQSLRKKQVGNKYNCIILHFQQPCQSPSSTMGVGPSDFPKIMWCQLKLYMHIMLSALSFHNYIARVSKTDAACGSDLNLFIRV